MQKILVIAGTNRPNSVSGKIAQIYSNILTEKGVEASKIDLSDLPPNFGQAYFVDKSMFQAHQTMIDAHQTVVFVVPEYNGSFPGALKSWLDGLRYPDTWRGKMIAFVGISSGDQGGLLAISHLTDIFMYAGGNILGLKVRLPFIKKNFENEVLPANFVAYLDKQMQEIIKLGIGN